MENHKHVPPKAVNFGLAFQQMCSMVAIGQTTSPDETLKELILQSIALLPEEKITNEHVLATVLNTLFGLQIAYHEIKYAIDRLTDEGCIIFSDTGNLILQTDVKDELKKRIDETYALEKKVRDGWFEEINKKYPSLSHPEIWLALRNYLAGAFLRHGIQAVSLLDSSLELDYVYSQSLQDLLRESVKDFPIGLQLVAKNVISNFMATVGQYPERAMYISQLADGAFSYFSLSSDPNVANQFRKNLYPLKLFLDTNFLFGILNLAIGPQVAVSNELIRVIKEYNFPFHLIRHTKTDRELLSSVSIYESYFLERCWSRTISRAAMTSRFLTGVEFKYHQAFIETGIDVQSFFRPYHHSDVLLNQKSIERYDDVDKDQPTERVATLITDYTEYLGRKKRNKPYKTIDHDMTVLDVVRQLRSAAKSTLEAEALIITCDYSLFRFDWETSKAQGTLPSTVLPNLFWQILRPFIPSDNNFSRAFAQTFSIPEFRTISSGSAKACSKMISILSGYKNFPEETAARMLSNDILIEQLRKAENDEDFQSYVEAAIVTENEQLIGENIMLAKKFEIEKTARAKVARQLQSAETTIQQINNEVTTERKQRVKAIENADVERKRRVQVEEKYKMVISIFISLVLMFTFEMAAYNIPWTWLISHPDSYGLQAGFDVVLVLVGFIVFFPRWRKFLTISLLLPIAAIIIQLLGGPAK